MVENGKIWTSGIIYGIICGNLSIILGEVVSTIKKLYYKVNRDIIPKDMTYAELERLLKCLDFEICHTKGDHVMFKHKKFKDIICSADSNGKRTLNHAYIKQAKEAIAELLERGGFNEDEL